MRWSEDAISDLQDVFDFIAMTSPQNALLVDDRINEEILELGRFSGLGREGRLPGTRELVVHRTGYVVLYREEEGDVLILGIVNGRQQQP